MALFSALAIIVSCLSGLWIPCTLLCCIPWVQKMMLYLHWVTMFPGKWLTEPERAGFLKNQVVSFSITTTDGIFLFAWLIVPLGAYARHADAFVHEPRGTDNIRKTLACKLLKQDPDARLLLYFHGNTATIAQERRTEEYRSYASGASEKIFILAFDYRGFGQSSGIPSEAGLLNDAEAVVEWALHTAQIPPNRIVLLGHSLGTAVVAGIAHRYAKQGVSFAGLILCAAFTNAGSAFASYSIGGIVPVLAPVKLLPSLQSWFSRRMNDTWRTDERLADLARSSGRLRLVLVHAEDDSTMPWNQTEDLFRRTLQAGAESLGNDAAGQDTNSLEVVDLGEAGRQEIWRHGSKVIQQSIAKHGGHNGMMKWTPVSLAILQVCGFSAPTLHV